MRGPFSAFAGSSDFAALGARAGLSAASAFSGTAAGAAASACAASAFSTCGSFFSSAMDQLSGLGRDAHLLAVADLEADAARLSVSGRDGDFGHVQRRFLAIDPALRVRLVRLAMARVDVDPRHDHLAVLRDRLDDLTRAPLEIGRASCRE